MRDYITYARAARILKTTTEEIANMVSNGDISMVLVNGRRRIVRQTLPNAPQTKN